MTDIAAAVGKAAVAAGSQKSVFVGYKFDGVWRASTGNCMSVMTIMM